MTAQPSLWDQPLPRRARRSRKADTSRDGLRAVAARIETQKAAILAALREMGPMTRHEIADATGYPLGSVCGRVRLLLDEGSAHEIEENHERIRRDGRHVVAASFTTRTEDSD